MQNIVTTLRERGLLQDLTDPALEELVSKKKITVYIGFDPTSDSLHVGHLVSVLILKHFQLHGHKPIAVVGGATGMVGDPSGRSEERNLLSREQLDINVQGIRSTLEKFLDFEGEAAARVVNNADWIAPFSFLDFLRDVGKHFRVGDMLAKDSVKSRLNSEAGLSFTEFSYQLLQAYDFLHLYRTHKCEVQAGGSDQWGNITAGTELIRRVDGGQGYGITTPLLTNSEGQKMGKTASGAVWLSKEKLSPYEFYQYWIRIDDRDVEKFLRMLTLMPLADIAGVMQQHSEAPDKRTAQRRLAWELTAFVHGAGEAQRAKDASEALFGGRIEKKSDAELTQIFNDVPSVEVPRAELDAGMPLLDLLVKSVCASKNEARRMLTQRGIYLNNSNEPVPADKKTAGPEDLASDTMLILRAGKKKYCLVKFV